MRILFISHSSPLKEGGAETRTREVAFRLARSGHEVTILCGKTHLSDPDVNEVNGVRIISRKTLPDQLLKRYPYPHYLPLGAANLFLMFHIPSVLRSQNFDLIREDMCPFPPSFLLSLVRLPVPRRIVIVHMLARSLKGWIKFYGTVFGFVGFIMDRLLRMGLLKYDRIISDSKWTADELRHHPRIANKVFFVPNGVDLNKFSPLERKRNNGQLRLLSVGRLVETKGLQYAIEALSYLKEDFPHVELTIVGNGPLKQFLIELARNLGVGDRVTFRAPVNHQCMPELMSEHDFFVMPSLWEGLPVSLIEAMASRLPVISTDIPAIKSILDYQSAALAAEANGLDLAEKLRWSFDNPDQVSKRAERAYELAAGYDWSTTASQEIDELQ